MCQQLSTFVPMEDDLWYRCQSRYACLQHPYGEVGSPAPSERRCSFTDIEPHNGSSCFFTRECYEKYSLGPTLAELVLLTTKSQTEPVGPQQREENPEPSVTKKTEVSPPKADGPILPDPRVPFPRYSYLTEQQQRTHVQLIIKFLNKKSSFKPTATEMKEYEHYLRFDLDVLISFQFLKSTSSSENSEFLKFLQNSARICADDYNYLSPDADLYTQELLKACQKYVKNYPELYTVHEITSILGGKFIPDLSLKLEKCLLKLGSADFVKIRFPTAELDLPTTFTNVLSSFPPSSKAALMHTSVISDPNSAKLAAKYSPQVVLTSQVLYTLLNNHGVAYKEQWEIPLRVKTITAEGENPKKIVYMDSPLPKKELNVRQKNHMFHEVPLDIFMLKKSSVLLRVIHLDGIEDEGQDAYLHVPFHPNIQMYLRLACTLGHFQFTALPNGLTTAPQVFARVLGAFIAFLRTKGLQVTASMDDLLLKAPSRYLLDCQSVLSSGVNLRHGIQVLIPCGQGDIYHRGGSVLHGVHQEASEVHYPGLLGESEILNHPVSLPQETGSPSPELPLERGCGQSDFDGMADEATILKRNGFSPEVVFTMIQARRPVYSKAYHRIVGEDSHLGRHVTSDSMDIDFESDVTELETFGSAVTPTKDSRSPESTTVHPKTLSTTMSLLDKKQVINTAHVVKMDNKMRSAENTVSVTQSLWSDTDDASSFEGFESDDPKASKESSEEGSSSNSGQESKMEVSSKSEISAVEATAITGKQPRTLDSNMSDSEDDRLVIDIDCENGKHSSSSVPPSLTHTQELQSLPRKPAKRISKEFDPVGQILKMQTQLLKPGTKKVHEQRVVNPEINWQFQPNTGPTPVEASAILATDPTLGIPENTPSSLKNSLLPSNLLATWEDETEYRVHPGENAAYKLFSLDDMLLLIRCNVHRALTRLRTRIKCTKKHIPVYVLAKVNYQSCYGVESLTESESCRLWTESLLHANCISYVGHIDAFTSKFFMLEEITTEGLKDRIGNFKAANCLNILRHILKWVTGLQDGSYLLSHVSGDSSVCLYKSISEKCRGSYNLHKAHSSLPKTPSSLSVPWVPLDPNLLLPYHIHHGRPPCTFPPIPQGNTVRAKVVNPVNAQNNNDSQSDTKMDTSQLPKKKNRLGKANNTATWKAQNKAWRVKPKAQKKA
ncbi:little elongation complex subunit 2 [Rhinophrynus dorsalis]